MKEEQLPHFQAATSSSRIVCSTIARIQNTSHEALLDSGSTISSISLDIVNQLHLPTSSAPLIHVIFGDKQKLYKSFTHAHCTFTLAQHTFVHSFYVLPKQLFPLTLGCDWFVKHGAQLHFDTQTLVLPHLRPCTTIPLLNTPHTSTQVMHTQIQIEPAQSRLTDLRRLLGKFPKIFMKTEKTTQVTLQVQHAIPTTDSPPVRMAARRRSPLDHQRINTAVQEMLQKDIIEPSSSEWVSEPHLVRKDDGTFRFCIDFRLLNKITKHDRYPLPRIDDLIDQLGKSRYFTSLDLASGYWQIPLRPEDKHKTAFRTQHGLYQFKRMPFGLSDAGSTFQRMANTIFQDLIHKGVILVYLDDILIHTADWSQHIQVLQEVLLRIQKYSLQLQFKKCKWGATELRFLGFMISSKGIQLDHAKIRAIVDYPTPSNIKSLQSFLGLVNFSLRFIPNLAMVTAPLRLLLKKGSKYQWSADCTQSFEKLKKLIKDAGTLAFPDFSKVFRLQTDASNYGIGAVLLQQDDNDDWQPIAYISRALTKSEQNYSTTEKEFLAIVWAFQKFHPYLHGTSVQVETDHQPLVSLIHKTHPPGRLLRWALALQEYSFTMIYRKGASNTVADALSRMEYHAAQWAEDANDLPFQPQQIAQMQQQDPVIKDLILRIQNNHDKQVYRHFVLIDNILHFISQGLPPRLYLPEALRATYLEFYHNHRLTGHFGFHKLLHRIRSMYYWPKLRQSISTFLQTCSTCQTVKNPQSTYGTLTPIEVKEPFEMVGWDLMGPFPTSIQGNKYILVITEYLTRWCEAAALPDATANTVANALLQRVIFPHGCPHQILSDQGSQFRSEVMQVLTQSLEIKQLFTSPYHPQTNGLTERMNKTIKQTIAAYVDPLHQSWDQVLPFAVHAYNTSVQESTKVSPFRALYGRDPRLPPDPHTIKVNPHHSDATSWWLYLQSTMPLLRRAIQYNLSKAQQRQKKYFDKSHRPTTLDIGEYVRVYYPVRKKGLCESFMHRWLGPYKIIARIGSNTYRLRRVDKSTETVAHVSRIRRIPPPTENLHPDDTGADDTGLPQPSTRQDVSTIDDSTGLSQPPTHLDGATVEAQTHPPL